MFNLVPYSKRSLANGKRGDLWDLRSVMDNFFNDSWLPMAVLDNNTIRTDIRETENEYIVEAEMPGVRKEDIRLELKDDILTISTEQKEEINEEKANYVRKERRYGSCSRSFRVDNIKNDAVSAKYEEGILKIVLPKNTEQKEKNQKIDIQ